jgi:hypothetical protein
MQNRRRRFGVLANTLAFASAGTSRSGNEVPLPLDRSMPTSVSFPWLWSAYMIYVWRGGWYMCSEMGDNCDSLVFGDLIDRQLVWCITG